MPLPARPSAQALSGTGALRVTGEFIKTHMAPQAHEIWVSDPTWGNHNTIFQKAGLTVRTYPYYEKETKGFNFDGMMTCLRDEVAPGAAVLLHACAHNPTGVDPTEEQWKQIADLMQEKKLVPLMDSAYQGYASGNLDKDAFAATSIEKQTSAELPKTFAVALESEGPNLPSLACSPESC